MGRFSMSTNTGKDPVQRRPNMQLAKQTGIVTGFFRLTYHNMQTAKKLTG